MDLDVKVICPPEDWQDARNVTIEDVELIGWIAKKLGLTANYDLVNHKYYLGLPRDNESDKGENANDSQPSVPASKTNDNTLRFTMRLPKQGVSSIIDGVITLNGKMYKACSGAPGSQVYGSYWNTGRSPIPPGLDYEVDLKWSYSPLTGISGRYYHILPDPIESKDGSGKVRTEIGLHQDNGAPGTAGCIGVVNSDWSKLCSALDELAKFNRYLHLQVNYLVRD